MVLYVDTAFVLNAALDYIVLCCTLRLCGLPLRQKRVLCAAAVGGFYGTAALFYPKTSLWLLLSQCAIALLMVRIAFGSRTFLLRRCLLFLLCSCALSGAAAWLEGIFSKSQSPWVIFLLSVLSCLFVLAVVFRGSAQSQRQTLYAELFHKGKKAKVRLLYDTGNTLCDPKQGETVCVIWEDAIEELLIGGETVLTYIPFSSLGQRSGTIAVFYCERLRIGEKVWNNYPVGLSPHPLSGTGGYVGLWGGERKGEREYA